MLENQRIFIQKSSIVLDTRDPVGRCVEYQNKGDAASMKKWRCTVCDEIIESETCPEVCPVCGAGPEAFEEVTE